MVKITIFELPVKAKVNWIMTNSKIVVLRLQYLSFGLQDQKTLKKFKISTSFFRDLLIGINQIDHKKPKNRGPETPGSILRASGHKAL